MSEDDILFLINVSEHVGNEQDVLMFLGEFFKKHLEETETVYNNAAKAGSSKKEVAEFFITSSIMN